MPPLHRSAQSSSTLQELQSQLDQARSAAADKERELQALQDELEQWQAQGHTSSSASSEAVQQLRGQLDTAAAVVHVTRQAVASCKRIIATADVPDIRENVELDVALLYMKVSRCSRLCVQLCVCCTSLAGL